MHPVLFEIGGFSLSTFGLMNMIGYLLAIFYLIHYREKIGIDKDTLWNMMFISILAAMIGGKLFHLVVEVPWAEMGDTLTEKIKNVLSTFRYGFTFFGGFLTGITALIIYLKKKKLPIVKTGDFIILGIPLGHAIGRIGCFLVGCCYGKPWDGPWAVHFTDPHSLVPHHLHGVGLHPTQLYEVVGNFIIFAIMHFAYRRKHIDGAIISLYALLYGTLRFIVEFFRADERGAGMLGLSPSQLVSIGIIVGAGVFYYIMRRRQNAK
ncbi:phosphatidylglycerol:prolipoprotein diacylglycerol transferase [Elusimicrobium simillimum]|uniref:prolipoprotein diacylglyceryl transferase n=1 Tax=Elusimicrobium simillimum TaxID=3143438 RepID=UPI003C7055ED